MTEPVEEKTEFPIRQVFIVSDGTAITAETLAHAITTQFPDLEYQQTRMPFVNTVEKAQAAAETINRIGVESGTRPIIFTTFVEPDIMRTFNEHVQGHIIDLFRKFVGPLETELGMKCAHSVGQSHRIRDDERYNKRIAAIDYTLQHDDGQTNRGLDEADVILVGVSRSGKTPTSLFLAMQYGIKVANYPLIPEDFERGSLPDALLPLRHKLFGLSIRPERLSEIRNERRPGSRYASIENCREEIFDAENLMRREGIRWGRNVLYSDFDNDLERNVWGVEVTSFLQDHDRLFRRAAEKLRCLLLGGNEAGEGCLIFPLRRNGET